MGRDYYYLSASLPALNFSVKPAITLEYFLKECERLMAPQDSEKIRQAVSGKDPQKRPGQDTFGQWIRFNRDFRNEMAHFRAKRAGREPQKYVRGERNPEGWMTDVIAQAAKAPDPLSAERVLDAARFEYLEKLAAGQFMNFDFLLTYGLKLKMIERYQQVESAKGEEIFEDLKQVDIKLD